MIRFNCDYQEAAHPRILERLARDNMVQTPGYGEDAVCDSARDRIRALCEAPGADVQFLVGGTQANFTLLAAALRSYQGVIAAETAHIAVHETGAVEATGHKVLTLPHAGGKITAAQVDACCAAHYADASHEHMVMPKALYISEATELGTIYNRAELAELREVCDKWKLYLYIDGARLGYGLAAEECDVDLPYLARVADAFYIGGTKQGALIGEAMVLLNDDLKRDFRYVIKQKGGMLAKGWLLGMQFDELFRNDLYFELSKHAVNLAMKLKRSLAGMGVSFLVDSPTNQQFPILSDDAIAKLGEKFSYSYQQRMDADHSAVRLCTSWATREEDVDALVTAIGKCIDE